MKALQHFHAWLLGASILLGGSGVAQATTYIVDPLGSGDFTTIQAAINAASSTDIIEIRGGTYSERPDLGGKDITLQSAAGADVVITGNGGPTLTVVNCSNATIKGTSDHPMQVTRVQADQYVEAGATVGTITFQYVNFTGNCGTWLASIGSAQPNPVPSVVFDHCQFTLTCSTMVFQTWNAVSLTLNDCTFDVTGDGQIVRHNSTGLFQANRCSFVAHGSGGMSETGSGCFQIGDGFGINDFKNKTQTIEAVDCVFQNYAWVYEQWAGQLTPAQGALKTIRLINPGLVANTIGLARVNDGENLIVKGKSATEKCDLTDDTALIHLISVVNGGNVLVEDVILKGSAWFGHAVNIAGNMDNNATVTLNRCLVSADNQANIGNRDNASGGGTATVALNLQNCILKFGGALVNLTGTNGTHLVLTHCTMLEKSGDTGVTGIDSGSNDTLASNYSIFNAADSSNLFADIGFSGTLNIVNHPTGNGFGGAIPGDTILGNPGLDSSGHLTLSSGIADQTAVGSLLAFDYDGDSRPWLGTVSDIGADEGENVPVELSSITVN